MRTMLGSTDSSYLDPNFEVGPRQKLPRRRPSAGRLVAPVLSGRIHDGPHVSVRPGRRDLRGLGGLRRGRRIPSHLSLTKYDSPVRVLAIDPTGMTLATAGQR